MASQLPPEFLRPAEAAAFLAVNLRTLQSWVATGRIKSVSLRPPGARHGVRLFRLQDLRQFVADHAERTAPVPAAG